MMPRRVYWTAEAAKKALDREIAEAKTRYERRLEEIATIATFESRPPKEREELAISLREAGNTFAQIGAHLGVSPYAASALFSRGLRRRAEIEAGGLFELSARAHNTLRHAKTWPVPEEQITPEMVAASLTERDLADMPNCGRHTIKEIAAWLNRNGLTLSP